MDVNADTDHLIPPGVLKLITSKLTPTKNQPPHANTRGFGFGF